MINGPRIVAVLSIVVGATLLGALHTQAGRVNLGTGPLPTIRDVAAMVTTTPDMQLAAMIRSVPEPAESEESDLIMVLEPATDPDAPLMPQHGAGLSERLAQTEPAIADTTEDPTYSAFGLPCGLTVTTAVMPAALVAVDVMDPCQPEARVVIEHSGLTITAQTDVMGILTLDLPVFETPAFVTVRMPDGTSSSNLVAVPEIVDFHRVGVQWAEDRNVELHALEFGARYDEPGHIWANHAGGAERAIDGEGGFLSVLGEPSVEAPMLAQIYTFPRDARARDGVVRLSIEAPITETNCGQDTMARTLETEEDGTVSVIELTFTLPTCDAVGDYLVLQNLLHDLRVAAN